MTTTFHRPMLVAHARYRWDKLRGEHQLVYPEGMLVLNESAAAIVCLCDGRPLAELLAALSEQVSQTQVADDVRGLLRRLAEKGLLRDVVDA